MVIRVEKPAFNLRSKLNELDYERIPYQKMPYGSVVDIDYAYNNTQSTHTDQNTVCVGPVVISRKDRNNAIWLYTSVEYYHDNANGKFGFQVSFDDGTTWVDLFWFHGEDDASSSNGYYTNSITGSYYYEPTGSMHECDHPQFRILFNHNVQNGGTLYLNRAKTGTNANFFAGACTLTAMEIRR